MPDSGRMMISNTSPLFYLHRIGHLDILPQLYGSVTVTPAVLAELQAGADQGEDVPGLSNASWVTVKQVSVPSFLSLIPDLGAGESSVLALAVESGDCTVIIDDMLGRRIAKLHSLRLTGTAGVLLRAKQAGIIPAVSPCLDQLDEAGFYLSANIRHDVLDLAGEI